MALNMKIIEMRQLRKEDLDRLRDEKEVRMQELGALLHAKKTKNVKELAGVRKDIARILTVLKEQSYAHA